MSISQTVADFVTLAIRSGGWMEMDRIYLQNRVLALIGEHEQTPAEPSVTPCSSLELLDRLVERAKTNQVISGTLAEREILEGQLMDLLTPPPSVVNAVFAKHYEKDKKQATDYFFELSRQNDYIKTRQIAKNIVYKTPSAYGELEITINLSKPEKDPKEIAQSRKLETVNYPKCQLCFENEGYKGRADYPARTNHRIIRMNLDGESWGFQYSPYAYYNEHAIFLSEEHRPMVINRGTFQRLLKIVAVLPHYFVGSNADLPIVGGSILSHDHYQGGHHTFPMAIAELETTFDLALFPAVSFGIVKWPMSVIRLEGERSEDLVNAAEYITEQWRRYSDLSLSIRAYSEDGTPHHTVTPIARMVNGKFQLDLVLRDNNVSEEFPDGIFHPHQDVHHIKKENIGLIEVMGLAVLPPRLAKELSDVRDYLLGKSDNIAAYHLDWAKRMRAEYQITEENAETVIKQEVGKIFERVLEDAGVFKRDKSGQQGFQRFISTL